MEVCCSYCLQFPKWNLPQRRSAKPSTTQHRVYDQFFACLEPHELPQRWVSYASTRAVDFENQRLQDHLKILRDLEVAGELQLHLALRWEYHPSRQSSPTEKRPLHHQDGKHIVESCGPAKAIIVYHLGGQKWRISVVRNLLSLDLTSSKGTLSITGVMTTGDLLFSFPSTCATGFSAWPRSTVVVIWKLPLGLLLRPRPR